MNMKGLLKGLKYFTQMFVEEEEEDDNDIQIGEPTDVKHVAHIGWDGPSASSPSWMNDFKSSTSENSSNPPIQANGDTNNRDIEDSQASSKKKNAVKESSGRDSPGLPKASRRQPSWDSGESSNTSPTHKDKTSKRRPKSKESTSAPKGESSSLPNIPKKSRKKKSKDAGDGSSKPSRSKEKSSRNGSKLESEDESSKQYREANSNTSLSSLKEPEANAW